MRRATPTRPSAPRPPSGSTCYIPLVKGWGTDLGVEVASLAVQVHGGMGYIEETGVAQFSRDVRITQIYEGTNGIQAMDLVGRKLPMRGGAVVADLVTRMRATADQLSAGPEALQPIGARLTEAVAVFEEAAQWLGAQLGADVRDALGGATPFLRLASQTVGGWLLGDAALAAQRELDAGRGDARLPRGQGRHRPLLRRQPAAAGQGPPRPGVRRRGRPPGARARASSDRPPPPAQGRKATVATSGRWSLPWPVPVRMWVTTSAPRVSAWSMRRKGGSGEASFGQVN